MPSFHKKIKTNIESAKCSEDKNNNINNTKNFNNINENSKRNSRTRIKLPSIIKHQSDNDLNMMKINLANFIRISSDSQLMNETELKEKIKIMENEMSEENMKILL